MDGFFKYWGGRCPPLQTTLAEKQNIRQTSLVSGTKYSLCLKIIVNFNKPNLTYTAKIL